MRLTAFLFAMLFLASVSAVAAGDKTETDPNSLPATGAGKTVIDTSGDCD